MQAFYSDLLFQVRIADREGYLYFLFEHKSYPDKKIAFQLWQYMLGIYEQKMKEKVVAPLPDVIPIVIYHEAQSWRERKTLIDWFGGEEKVESFLRPFIPQFEFLYYDIAREREGSFEDVNEKLRAYVQLLQHVYSDDEDGLYTIIVALDEAKELRYLETVFIYLLTVSETFSIDRLKERLSMEGRKRVMTVAEQLRREGREEGREEGVEDIVLNMLQEMDCIEEISRLTKIPKDKIEQIKKKHRL